jgi:hypothetical protein
VLLHRFSDATRSLDYFIFIKASVTVDTETALVFWLLTIRLPAGISLPQLGEIFIAHNP